MTTRKLLEAQSSYCAEAYLKEGPTPKGTFQNSLRQQYHRYDKLLQQIPSVGRVLSVHDVGSGICDLHKYLLESNISHIYSGTEIVQEKIDYSLKLYPEIKLYRRDLLSAPAVETYDVLFLSGTFNNVPGDIQEEWKPYCFELMRKMYEMSQVGMAFNFLTTYKTFSAPELAYFDPRDVYDFCMTKLSRFTTIDSISPFFECTCTVLKPEFVRDSFCDEEYSKYFKVLRLDNDSR